MADIFISHSRLDLAIVEDFENIFARTNLRAHLLEFETYRVPPWIDIREKVQTSAAVFVLLGPGVKSNAYTQNWIAWEAGVASAHNKPLWVYERLVEPVGFPVPYCTDYVLYDAVQRDHLDYIKRAVESYDPSPKLAGLVLGALAGAAVGKGAGAIAGGIIGTLFSGDPGPWPPRTTCPYPTCSVTFRAHTGVTEFLCPSCRQSLRLAG